MKAAELREKYLSFFEAKGCKRMPSSSIIPDDPSLLLTSAGMVQFKPYFLQEKQLEEPYIGTTTVQKCVRTSDIENIGVTGRHLSFFEMLGNFSFGKYFKKEMCAWAWEFSTEVMGLDPERIYITIYLDDDETFDIWRKIGVAESHITRLGDDDNFWRAGPTGPCGPCSELYYDQGEEMGCGKPDCGPGCECDRFLEYWNLVFTQYDGQEDGSFKPLPKKNIDTGMGLERAAAILQGVQSNYDTDIMQGFIKVGERLSGKKYHENPKTDMSLRIVADHSRAVTFMIADGILPSNEGRGYVLRRLLRRAVRHGRLLGIKGTFLREYVEQCIECMGDVYPEIVENRSLIEQVVLSEEVRFGQTLRQGEEFLEDELAKIAPGEPLSGHAAFTLHDTYGFPVEITQEICAEKGVQVDMDVFSSDMEQQRARARAALTGDAWETGTDIFTSLRARLGATSFLGYSDNEADAEVLAIVKEGVEVDSASEGEKVDIILSATPFYGERGGQVGDTGIIEETGMCSVHVDDTKIAEKDLVVHKATVLSGTISTGESVHAAIDVLRRERIRRNHTATHILHWALRQVLGDHVKQAGSYVAPDRLRFDFTHFEAVSPEQLAEVERLANEKIMENGEVHSYETSLVSAREAGVMALFGEKYGEFVRVLECGDYSKELCGGTHVGHTSEIGFIKVLSEGSVAANMRRIEAVTSFDALEYMNGLADMLKQTASLLKVPMRDVPERTASDVARIKDYEAKAKKARLAATQGGVAKLLESAVDVGYPLVVADAGKLEAAGLRTAWDVMSQKMERPGAVVLAAINASGAPVLLAAGSKEAVDAGFDAGAVIKAIAPMIGGGGGGKPAMAQAGGKDASGIAAALDKAREMFRA